MSGSTSSLFAALARLSLIVTLVVAPWPFGSYPLAWQPPIFAGILTSLVCWWLSVITRPSSHPEGGTILVDGLLPPTLLIGLAAFQLIPFANVPEIPQHAVLADATREEIESTSIPAPTPISVAPSLTRESSARLLFGLCAAFLGIQLFRDAGTRMWLYVPIALNAAAIASFGIWQKIHWKEWNEMMFGSVPIASGGLPFGPFVNRNNAAGMLNMGAAAAAGWAFLAAAPRVGAMIRRAPEESLSSRAHSPRGSLTGFALVPAAILIVILAGVASSLSRGGILASAAGILVALVILLQSRRLRAVGMLLLVLLPATAITIGWTGFGKELKARFAVLKSYTYEDGRIGHWSETWGAVQDAPWLGQGMGAYRYINRPYLKSDQDRWYVNADNQFFELLVENGAVGLLLAAATILLLSVDVRRILLSRAPWEQRDAALLGGILLTTQAVQGISDFGIIVPSNLLTAGALAGVLAGTAARSLPFSLVPNVTSPMVFRPITAIPIGLILLAGTGFAWRELQFAANADAATRAIGALDTPEAIAPGAIDVLTDRLTKAANVRPDDAELQRTLGNLLTFRFRTQLLNTLRTSPRNVGKTAEQLWPGTAIEALLTELTQIGDETGRRQFLASLASIDPEKTLEKARDAYQSSLAGCRWIAIAGQKDAAAQMLVSLDQNAARRSLALAAAGSPGDSGRLIVLGAMAQELDSQELATAIWKQAILIAPQKLADVLQIAGPWARNANTLKTLLPPTVDPLLEYAESPVGTPIAQIAAERVEELLSETPSVDDESGRLGRVRRLQGRRDEALELFETAARRQPLDWRWRVYAADIKMDLGREEEAIRDLTAVQQDFPRQSLISEKWRELRKHSVPAHR